MYYLIIVLALIGVLTACSSTNLAEVVKAEGNDPATVCLVVTTPQGTMHMSRSNMQNGEVECTNAGMTVRAPSR